MIVRGENDGVGTDQPTPAGAMPTTDIFCPGLSRNKSIQRIVLKNVDLSGGANPCRR